MSENESSRGEAAQRKRIYDRERIAAQRATLTSVERAERRRDHDATYRAAHREQRRAADSRRSVDKAVAHWLDVNAQATQWGQL